MAVFAVIGPNFYTLLLRYIEILLEGALLLLSTRKIQTDFKTRLPFLYSLFHSLLYRDVNIGYTTKAHNYPLFLMSHEDPRVKFFSIKMGAEKREKTFKRRW